MDEALQGPVIMMSQNRQGKKDRLRGELDFDVNRRAAADIQNVAGKMNLLVDKVGDLEDHLRALRLPVPQTPCRDNASNSRPWHCALYSIR
jgi:uncharacterized membrane protein